LFAETKNWQASNRWDTTKPALWTFFQEEIVNDSTLAPTVPGAASGGRTIVGVLLIILGLLAIVLPFIAGIAITAFIGWLLLFAGIVHLIYSWHSRKTSGVIWQILIAILYLFVGFYLIFHPARGLVTLTLLLASYFVVEGVIELVLYFRLRSSHRSGWFLWDGLITLLLGILIWAHWPFSSVWVLGTLIGISLLISGFTRLFAKPTLTSGLI
jgi:uncharacterized membrane protein HdeD (DUF308 family)